MLAVAQGHPSGFLNDYLFRGERSPLVRTIAKGLILRTPTGTPPIVTWFKIQYGRYLGCDYGFLFHKRNQ